MEADEIFDITLDRRGAKRTVPMKVLCLAPSRSGTASLTKALYILGLPTYHGFQAVYNHHDALLWREAVAAKWYNKGKMWEREDFDQLLGDFSACTDFPAAAFAPELIKAYPEAKVILNSRPFDLWYKSYLNALQVPIAENYVFRFLTQFDYEARSIFNFWVWFSDTFFRGDFRRNAKAVYEEHRALIRGAAPKDAFLEWDVTQGWAPLCEFLDMPIPNEPFPSGNKAQETTAKIVQTATGPRMARAIRKLMVTGLTLTALLGVVVARYLKPTVFQQGVHSISNVLRQLGLS